MKKIKRMALPAIAIILAIAGILTGLLSSSTYSSYARGGNLVGTLNERIDYVRKEVDQYIISPALPSYSANGYSCGVTAGGIAIVWHQKNLPNLIPNHTAGVQLGTSWFWTGLTPNNPVMNMFATLNIDMGATSLGITIGGYLEGLETYVTRQGYTFEYENTMGTSGVLDDKYKAALRDGKLLSIFMDGFNITFKPDTYSNYDTVKLEQYAGAHIMTAYGYYDVKYFNANDMFRQDTYLLVNDGFGSLSYLRLTSHITIDDCYILNIF